MIGIIVAWVTVSVSTVNTEKQLQEAANGIESLVKRGRSLAVLQQRPYEVTISPGSISLAPKYMRDEQESYDDESEDAPKQFENVTVTESMDSEVKYEIRRWRSANWLEITGDNKVVLTLDPAGLVEPISIRCSVGESWISHTLSPLTGSVRDEEMSVQE